MHCGRVALAGLLFLLFFGLSFNAYACLVPIYGTADAMRATDCSSPQEEPARQFCDAFKTLSVQSAGELHQNSDCQTICSEDTASLSPLVILTSHSSRLYDHPADGPPPDILLKTAVLRI